MDHLTLLFGDKLADNDTGQVLVHRVEGNLSEMHAQTHAHTQGTESELMQGMQSYTRLTARRIKFPMQVQTKEMQAMQSSSH